MVITLSISPIHPAFLSPVPWRQLCIGSFEKEICMFHLDCLTRLRWFPQFGLDPAQNGRASRTTRGSSTERSGARHASRTERSRVTRRGDCREGGLGLSSPQRSSFLTKAEAAYRRSLDISVRKRGEMDPFVAAACCCLRHCMVCKNDLEKGLEYGLRAQTIYEKTGGGRVIDRLSSAKHIANIQEALGEVEEARRWNQDILELLQAGTDIDTSPGGFPHNVVAQTVRLTICSKSQGVQEVGLHP